MSVARGTTPTFIFDFTGQDVDFTEASGVYVTFAAKGKTITKSGDDLTVLQKQISVTLSQRDTLQLDTSSMEAQVNWTYPGGRRACSDVKAVPIGRNLLLREV